MSALSARFDQLKALLDDTNHVVVSCHEQADGDAVGAVAAMRRHLEMDRKNVTAVLLEPLSPRYAFMEFGKRYEVYEPQRHEQLLREADVFIMCDLSSTSRLGALWEPISAGKARTVCIDHHPCADDGPADINVLDSTATASGRIVWDYIHHVQGTVDREIAESVFVSLGTDTGWFRYQNTDAGVLQLVAELAGYGLDLPAIYRAIYQSNSIPLLRLLGHVTRTINDECDGALVWSFVRSSLVRDLNVERFDADPILDVLRSGAGVRVVALFTELQDGRVNVSLRSRGMPDVNLIARQFGGGGHAFAAGATLPGEESVRALVGALRKSLRVR